MKKYLILIIFFSTLLLSCKKIGKNHEINSSWTFHYTGEGGTNAWIPASVSPIVLSFDKKSYSSTMPINNITGKCEVYKNGNIKIVDLSRSLVSGDSTSVYWEEEFIEQFGSIESYEIQSDTLRLLNGTATLIFSR
jgi:heat shock protein HslJ